MVVSMSCQQYLLLSTLLLLLVSEACVSSLLPAEASAEAYSAQLAENEAGSRRAGRDRKMGVPELELSQCDTNPVGRPRALFLCSKALFPPFIHLP